MTKPVYPDSIVFLGYTYIKVFGDYVLKIGGQGVGVNSCIFTGRESTEKYSCTLSFYKYSPLFEGSHEDFSWSIRTHYYPTLEELESKVLEIFETMCMPAEYWRNLEQLRSDT